MRQLTIDGRQEDIPERHEQPRMFEAPKTMKGQLSLVELGRAQIKLRAEGVDMRGMSLEEIVRRGA